MKWIWGKRFKNIQIGNVVTDWSASKVLFSLTELKDGVPMESDIIVGMIGESGAMVREWRVEGRVMRLSLGGAGKSLLVQFEDGGTVLYSDWEKGGSPIPIPNAALGSILSPKGEYVAAPSKNGTGMEVFSLTGESLWSFPEGINPGPGTMIFPFLNKKESLLQVSNVGELMLSDQKKVLWKKSLNAKPLTLASSLLEGESIVVSTKNVTGSTVTFFKADGTISGKVDLTGMVTSLSCANIGNFCAAYSNSLKEQRLDVFSSDGKKVWSYSVGNQASKDSKVIVSGLGKYFTSAFQEAGTWFLRTLNDKGEIVWDTPVKKELDSFTMSWSGKKIAAITNDRQRLVFFNEEINPEG